jgi:peptidoglycan hydrolase CwlO-like protein
MSNDERDRLMIFLIEKHEEVMADLSMLKDAQLRVNTQIEKLNKVVFGLAQQINDLLSKMPVEEEEKDWMGMIRPLIPRRK